MEPGRLELCKKTHSESDYLYEAQPEEEGSIISFISSLWWQRGSDQEESY